VALPLKPAIAIHGIGLCTPLASDASAVWTALLRGAFIETHGRSPLARESDVPRVNRLAAEALWQAVRSMPAGPDPSHLLRSPRTALVVGTSRGAVDHWIEEQFLPPLSQGFGLSSLAVDLSAMIGHGEGPRLTFCGACASGLHALIRAAQLIEQGIVDRAVVVGAESSLHPIFLQSFRRLGVLAPPGSRCRPFDINRQGLLVSEAAAAVILAGTTAPRPGDLLIDRCAFAGDAAHLTGFDPGGATMGRVLTAAIDGRPVDVIHAHGTGTIENDAAEAAAIDAVLAELPRTAAGTPRPPSVYSHKGAIGHSLGASGLVSVVLNRLMHQHGVVPPNVGIETPMPLRHATPSREPVLRPVRRSVVCAAGFGGATAAISLVTTAARVSGSEPA